MFPVSMAIKTAQEKQASLCFIPRRRMPESRQRQTTGVFDALPPGPLGTIILSMMTGRAVFNNLFFPASSCKAIAMGSQVLQFQQSVAGNASH